MNTETPKTDAEAVENLHANASDQKSPEDQSHKQEKL